MTTEAIFATVILAAAGATMMLCAMPLIEGQPWTAWRRVRFVLGMALIAPAFIRLLVLAVAG